jgi:hypothetical protein
MVAARVGERLGLQRLRPTPMPVFEVYAVASGKRCPLY